MYRLIHNQSPTRANTIYSQYKSTIELNSLLCVSENVSIVYSRHLCIYVHFACMQYVCGSESTSILRILAQKRANWKI